MKHSLNHTPGPWEIWGNAGEMDIAVGPKIGGVAIAQIVTVDGTGIMREETARVGAENARLIASAPDLLAALHSVLEWTDTESCKRIPIERREVLIRAAATAALQKLLR